MGGCEAEGGAERGVAALRRSEGDDRQRSRCPPDGPRHATIRRLPGPRCLVVSPDREFAYTLSGIISRHGLDVDIATDAWAALLLLRADPVDLFIYDVSSDSVDHDMVLDTLQSDLPAMLAKTVLLTTTPFDGIRVPAGVPVVGKNDLKPLMRYLTNE